MTEADLDQGARQQAIELYDRFTHDGMERRDFMAQMVRLAGSVAAAELLIAGIAASPAAAAQVAENDPHIFTRKQALTGDYKAYVAEPRTRSLKATVLVIHENRGLNDHIRDIARRLAIAGYRAVAPDMLSPSGGTPSNEDAAREAIGKLDLGKSVGDAVAMVDELAKSSRGGKVGAVGFCWGGGVVGQVAVNDPTLDAAVVYYGRPPAAEDVAKITAPLLLNYAGLDQRLDALLPAYRAALDKAGVTYTLYVYDGADHAFNNDTSPERYNAAAAKLAWDRTLAFLAQNLTS